MRLGSLVSKPKRFLLGVSAITASLQFQQLVTILCHRQATARSRSAAESALYFRASRYTTFQAHSGRGAPSIPRSAPRRAHEMRLLFVIGFDQTQPPLWEHLKQANRKGIHRNQKWRTGKSPWHRRI